MKVVVLFTGSQSTGKTTTLYKVAERLQVDHTVISGGSRPLKEIGMLNNVDLKANAVEQMILNAELLMKYYETMPSDIPLILSERTPVCVYSYARHIKDVPQYVLDFNDRFLKSTLKRKDLRFITIYFPTNIDFVADEVRLHSSRELIDETIRQILSEYNIEYYTMNETNLDTRVEIILTLIQQAVKEETPGSPIIYKRFLMGD